MVTGVLTLLSQGDNGQDAGSSSPPGVSISTNGRTVALGSIDDLSPFDTDAGLPDIFVRDMQTGSVVLASTELALGSPDGASDVTASLPSLSADGSRVAFGGGSCRWMTSPCVTAAWVKDVQADTLTLASRRSDGTQDNAGTSSLVRISGDGLFVSFSSYATNFDPSDTDAIPDIYLKNLDSGDLSLVSQADDERRGTATRSCRGQSAEANRLYF